MTGDPARVFVVAPTPLARVELRSILQGGEPDMLVVGEAGSFEGPGLSVADVVVVAGDETLEEAGAGEGTQAVLLIRRRPLRARPARAGATRLGRGAA